MRMSRGLHEAFRSSLRRKRPHSFAQIQNKLVAKNALDCLPAEIWLMIYCSLDAVDAGCLSLSSVSMLRYFGIESFRRLDDSRNRLAKAQFLSRLEGNIPQQLLCFICLKFHCQKRVWGLSPPHCHRIADRGTDLRELTAKLWDRGFLEFSAVQSVMRAHREGSLNHSRHTNKFATLCLNLCLKSFQPCKYYEPVWKHHFEAVITTEDDPHLLLHSCSILPTSELVFDDFMVGRRHWRKAHLSEQGVLGCQHTRIRTLRRYWLLCLAWNRYVRGPWDTAQQRVRPGHVYARCAHCPTEYHIILDANKVYINVWIDLGNGQSPFEGEWAAIVNRPNFGTAGAPVGPEAVLTSRHMPVYQRWKAAMLVRKVPKRRRPKFMRRH